MVHELFPLWVALDKPLVASAAYQAPAALAGLAQEGAPLPYFIRARRRPRTSHCYSLLCSGWFKLHPELLLQALCYR